MLVVKYMFQPHGDARGQLIALEEFRDIPFEIKRVYYMSCSQKVGANTYLHPWEL